MLEEKFDKKLDKVVSGLDDLKKTVNNQSHEVAIQISEFKGDLKALNDRMVTLLEYAQRNEERLNTDIRDLRDWQSESKFRITALDEKANRIPDLEKRLSEQEKAIEKFVPKEKLDERFVKISESLGKAEGHNAVASNLMKDYVRPLLIGLFVFLAGLTWNKLAGNSSISMTSAPTINTPSK